MSAGLLLLLLHPLRRTSTASARSQRSLPDPNSKPKIRVLPAGPQLQARDRSGPCQTRTANPRSECSPRTSTASARSQRSHARPEQQAQDQSGPRRDLNCKRWIAVFPAGPQPQRIAEDISDRMPEKNVRECQNKCQKECQNECLKRCQIKCQKECQNLCQEVCQNRYQIECQSICQKECQILSDRMSE